MTVNEPGLLGRRQMALTHPLASSWPQWLRAWWGQIQPPSLLLRIAAFPMLTRLPSPSLFPSLALDVLGRMNSFLTASLPFLDPADTVGQAAATTPRLDYRMRHPRTAPVGNAQLEFGAPAHAEVSPLHALHGSLQRNASELEPGATAQAHVSTDHEPAEADSLSHEAASEGLLTPFQHTEWEAPETAAGHIPTLEEAVHRAEEWHEAWSAVDLQPHVPQTIGVLRNSIGSVLRSSPAQHTPVTTGASEAALLPIDLTSDFTHLLNAPQDLAGPILSGLENASSLQFPLMSRLPGSPAQHVRRALSSTPRIHDQPPGNVSVLAENLAGRHETVLGVMAETTLHHESTAPTPFGLLGAAPNVPTYLTSHQNPILDEVLHRQELAADALSLVTHRPAELAALPLPAVVAAGESADIPVWLQPGELASRFQPQLGPLQRFASLPSMALRTAHIVENRASSLARASHLGSPLDLETHGREALPLPYHATAQNFATELALPQQAEHTSERVLLQHAVDEYAVSSHTGPDQTAALEHENQHFQAGYTAQASDPMQLNGIRYAAQPVFDLVHRLDTAASSFNLPSFQSLRQVTSAGGLIGMATRGSLPGLSHREPATELAHPVRTAHLPLDLPDAHVSTAFVAGSPEAMTHTVAEQFGSPPGQMHLGGPIGLSLLGREFAQAGHPLALRPLPDIANLLGEGTEQLIHLPEHAARLSQQVLNQSLAQELLGAPRMDLRREGHMLSPLSHAQANTGEFATDQWFAESGGPAVDHRVQATQHPAEIFAETTPGPGDAASAVWQGSGAAPAAAPGGAADVDSLARQVFALLQSQLRAERDRHQLYDR